MTRTRSASELCTLSQYPADVWESRARTSPVIPRRCPKACALKYFMANDFSYKKKARSRCSAYTRTLERTFRVQEYPIDTKRLVLSA